MLGFSFTYHRRNFFIVVTTTGGEADIQEFNARVEDLERDRHKRGRSAGG